LAFPNTPSNPIARPVSRRNLQPRARFQVGVVRKRDVHLDVLSVYQALGLVNAGRLLVTDRQLMNSEEFLWARLQNYIT
jgi:hypothetical protein